jgi:hypothetical protein
MAHERSLSGAHRSSLVDGSGIAPEVITARGYWSATSREELREIGFGRNQLGVPALVVPVWDVYGRQATNQSRPDAPRMKRGKSVKYETCAGARMVVDVHPHARTSVGDPSVPLFVTEGVKKGDALVSRGVCAAALLGVWNWRGTNDVGGVTALADWESIALQGRAIYVVFDSDAMTKPGVDGALTRFVAFLKSRGGEPTVIYLPSGPNGAKVGVDDYLVAGATVDDMVAATKNVRRAGGTGIAAGDGRDDRTKSQATLLVEIADDADLFGDQLQDAYAAIQINGHRETRAIRSAGFKRWLVREFYRREAKAPNGSSVADALSVIEARAQFDGDQRHVWHRVGQDDRGLLYLDLGTPDWTAVRVTPAGWEVVSDPPVHFRRDRMTGPLPMPAAHGSLAPLLGLLNVRREDDRRRIVAWLVGVLRPRGPYAVLVFIAEQGAGKSLTARILRSCLDPAPVHLRGMPRDERDLVIAARANHVVGLDNISTLPQWLTDALCRLATGAGWATRRLYTDADEEVFAESRPVIMTGIEDFVANADLLDRTLLVSLDAIPPERRKRESEILATFEAAHPTILAALLDAASAALRNLPSISFKSLPRMADFAAWVVAAEETLPWPTGGFLASYAQGVTDANDVILEGSIIADPVRNIVLGNDVARWTGTSTTLLAEMTAAAPEDVRRRKEWPKSARGLSGQLRRLAPTLRNVGIDVTFTRDDTAARRRLIVIRARAQVTVQTVHTVQPESASLDRTDAILDGWQPVLDGQAASPPVSREPDLDGPDGLDGCEHSVWEEEVV